MGAEMTSVAGSAVPTAGKRGLRGDICGWERKLAGKAQEKAVFSKAGVGIPML